MELHLPVSIRECNAFAKEGEAALYSNNILGDWRIDGYKVVLFRPYKSEMFYDRLKSKKNCQFN